MTALAPETLSRSLEDLTSFLSDHLGEDFVALALFGSQARGTADEDSDVDLLLIARHLNENLWERGTEIARMLGHAGPPGRAVLSRTPEEFLGGFPSYYLDLGLDAIVLHDTDSFLTNALARIREIIDEAGLERQWLDERHREYLWAWTKHKPKPGKWSVTWEGYRDCA